MTYVRYDEQLLIRKLDQLDPRSKAAFAAACAERQMPGYIVFSEQTRRGDPATLISILERVWRDLGGDQMPDDEIHRELDRCMELIPQEDEGSWVPEQAYAEDAASAVAYALRARSTGESQEAAYAARVAYEALDYFVSNRDNIDRNIPGEEQRVLSAPLVQAEIERQRRDLDELLGAQLQDVTSAISRVRDRAKAEAAEFFGPVS